MKAPLSVLDLAPVPSGSTASTAARRTVDLALLADELGYKRHWFAEHHSMPSIASFAGSMGVGYGFARHFSHKPVVPAVQAYRDNFEPSSQFEEPHVILAVSVVCAETNKRAEHLAATLDLVWARLKSGKHAPLPSPEEAKSYDYSPAEMQAVRHYRSLHFVGDPETVRNGIEELVDETEADEVMVSSIIYEHQARLRSYELLADVFETQTAAPASG